ncbi:MAG: DUF1552 domain-containing protein, partial [Planctomycetaceae bacterium]|nr:DUF1552 domain-containing protein [Planctomycetaceae bacterium]
MKRKSWHLNRRMALKSTGVGLALPWLEGMASDQANRPRKRFFAGYFAYGVPMPADGADDRMQNGWFPVGEGKDYAAPEMHQSIMPLRDKITFLSGLSHPSMRRTSAHKGADYFLTGADILKTYDKQSISIDQHLAQELGKETRFRSLVMSSLGGVNRPYRSSTLSFDRSGRPIPAQNKPAEIFRRMFGEVTQSEQNALASRGSIIDEVLNEAQDLNQRLGANDRRKMDEYLSSVREVEQMTERAKRWQNTPKPDVTRGNLELDANPTSPEEYLTVM